MAKKLFLGLVVCLWMLIGTNAWALQSGDYVYSVLGGEVTIERYTGSGGDVIIPDTIDGMPVVSIGGYLVVYCWYDSRGNYWCDEDVLVDKGAFENTNALTSVVIPNSVTIIGPDAFNDCEALTSVTIGNSVTSIGAFAFRDSWSLTSVIIPDSVTSIGENAFGNSGLTSVVIPDSVTSIGVNAFTQCHSLTSVTIPDSVSSIGNGTFSNCDSLPSIIIPDSVTSIGDLAFSRCGSLTSVTIPDSVISIGDSAFYHCGPLTSVTIGNSVISIGEGAFKECYSLLSITIPDSVTSIGDEAFIYCGGLTSVTIGNSVTSIGNYAFTECDSLTSAIFLGEAPSMGSSVFREAASDFSICYTPTATGFTTPTWEGYPAADCACSADIDCEENEMCEQGQCLPLVDTDLDGISDAEDNCPAISNADQADQDNDGIGNVCDTEPFFYWATTTENVDDEETVVPMENGKVYDNDRLAIIWTTKDPDAPGDGLGWSSRLGIAHSYVSYREVGDTTWSTEEETVQFAGLGFFGRWSWFYPVRTIAVNGNYEIKLIAEDSDGNRAEEVWTVEVAVP